jgi:hypothetical protein
VFGVLRFAVDRLDATDAGHCGARAPGYALRARIPCVQKPDVLTITSGINSLGPEAVAGILAEVRDFKDFNEDNDPRKEHDFGCFTYAGNKVFWKIDDYDGEDGYRLVLTVMLAEEY